MAGGLVVAGLLIAWRVAAIGFAGYVAAADPALALRADPSHVEALLRQSRSQLAEAITPADAAAAEALARRALKARPLNAPALRELAFVAADRGDEARADALMAQAAALSRRDPPASSWMYSKAMREGDYREAFLHADSVLRRSPGYSDRLYSPMVAAAENPAAAAALAERLSHAPVWRPTFLAVLARQGSEQAVRTVLQGVQAGEHPLEDQELAWVLRWQLERYGRLRARTLWTELLPAADKARLAAIFDGGFETSITVQPFGWQAGAGNASVEFAPVAGAEGKALHAEHFGSGNQNLLGQMTVLTPGSYQLTGRAMAESGGEPDALVWSLSCEANRTPLLEVRPAQAGGWRPFSAAFTVPAGCEIQWLALEARPMSGGGASVWFDDLRIEAAGAPS